MKAELNTKFELREKVYAGEDVECPHCHLHFTPSQEEIKESLRNQ